MLWVGSHPVASSYAAVFAVHTHPSTLAPGKQALCLVWRTNLTGIPPPIRLSTLQAAVRKCCSLGLPLELPAHLAVQLLCLALMLPRVHTCCLVPVSAPACAWPRRTPLPDMRCPTCSSMAVGCPFVAANVPGPASQPLPRSPPRHLPLQLLANPAQRRRIAALHSMAAGSVGIFAPPEELLGGPQAQCTALLAFLLLFCGGVLPTLAIVRWTWLGLKAAAQGEQRQQRLEGEQSRGATPPSSPQAAWAVAPQMATRAQRGATARLAAAAG